MAKRFTDTEKWKRAWFGDLPPLAKLVWFYLLDECDSNGTWHSNIRRLRSDIGENISLEAIEGWFGSKLIKVDDDKYFISSFVDFQYGELSLANNAHKPVLSFIEKNKLSHFVGRNKDLPTSSETSMRTLQGANQSPRGAQEKEKEKEKESAKDQEKEKDTEKENGGNLKNQISRAVQTWMQTLDHLKIERAILPAEQTLSGRLIQANGLEATDLAFIGCRYEPSHDGYDPKTNVSMQRLSDPKTFQKFLNLGAMKKTVRAVQAEKAKKQDDFDGEEFDPNSTAAIEGRRHMAEVMKNFGRMPA